MTKNLPKNDMKKRTQRLRSKINRLIFGMNFTDGLLYRMTIYTLLISFSYVYLYPILFMMVNSLMGVEDLINSGVVWIPMSLNFLNYERAIETLSLPGSLFSTTGYVLTVSTLITMSSALIGYGFAKFDFPFRRLMFVLMLITFILPTQVTMAASIITYRNLGLMSNLGSMFVPAIFGQGLNQAILILIFFQFFRSVPAVLTESAEIDGASQLKIFLKINLPLAIPSIIVVFLFSFVFYWNETLITAFFTGGQTTLPIRLIAFENSYATLFPPGTPGAELNEAILLAGSVLAILPLLVIYFIGQKWFVESIDKTGITGE